MNEEKIKGEDAVLRIGIFTGPVFWGFFVGFKALFAKFFLSSERKKRDWVKLFRYTPVAIGAARVAQLIFNT